MSDKWPEASFAITLPEGGALSVLVAERERLRNRRVEVSGDLRLGGLFAEHGSEAHRLIQDRLEHGASLAQALRDARNWLRFGTR